MAIFHRENFKIADIIRWERERRLKIQPKFQRRSVWEPDARAYLIDTVVRNFPMPKIYLRIIKKRSLATRSYEVIDGQQRLRAILDFHKNKFGLSRSYNPGYGNKTFDQLPDPIQRRFLQYEISTEVMEEATDREVWGMFERLNTYNLTLNRQERLNAKWFGYFKRTCYKLAAEQTSLNAWKGMKVFTDRQILRMSEVELTGDVLVAMLEGISDITDIAKAYKKYDKDFPKQKFVVANFRNSLTFIRSEFGDTVKRTRFRKRVWFYSLMTNMIDARVGIENGYGVRRLLSMEEIRGRMLALDSILTPTPIELPQSLAALHQSLSRQTSHVRPRQIRHEYFYAMLTLSTPSWNEKLHQPLVGT